MAAARARLRREIGVDVEKARTGHMPLPIELAAALGVAELPAAVDELVVQAYQLPAGDGGRGAELGWMT
jgi:hypothetical protein